jgi:phosphoserine phosphatase
VAANDEDDHGHSAAASPDTEETRPGVEDHSLMTDPLPSWNDGSAKQGIVAFVKETTTPGSAGFVPENERIAAFDQDGTTWVEQPQYAQLVFTFDQIAVLAAEDPQLKELEPFKTVLSGDNTAIAKLPLAELLKMITLTHSGMTVDAFEKIAHDWITTAQHPRFKRLYTDLVYQPMLEVMQYLRDNGYKMIIVTGGGQDFVRTYAERVYGIPRDQVVGSAAGTSFSYDATGKPILTKDPKLLWINDKSAKPVEIHQAIGRRPVMAFGNGDGDQHMLEYTQAGEGARFMMLIHHDDATREYATDSTMSVFSEALMAQAKRSGWHVVSMKNDWQRIFAWQSR